MTPNPEPTQEEQKAIDEARVVEEFLTNPIIERRVLALHQSYFNGFKSSKNIDEQNSFGAKGRALDDLLFELKKVVDAGVVAKTTVQRRQPRNPQKR